MFLTSHSGVQHYYLERAKPKTLPFLFKKDYKRVGTFVNYSPLLLSLLEKRTFKVFLLFFDL